MMTFRACCPWIVLAIKHRVWLPVYKVGDVAIKSQSPRLHPERVAASYPRLGGRGEVGGDQARDLEHGGPLPVVLGLSVRGVLGAITRPFRALLESFCNGLQQLFPTL